MTVTLALIRTIAPCSMLSWLFASALVANVASFDSIRSMPSTVHRGIPHGGTPFRDVGPTRHVGHATVQRTASRTVVQSRRENDDHDNGPEDHQRFLSLPINQARTDIRNFLSQRALQSFLFLLQQCRDEATVHWFEKTFACTNLENYHGSAALNLTLYPEWDSLLSDLVVQPTQIITIRSKRRGRGHGGWSKHNPYLEERFVEFEVDIEPPALVQRILSVREQIANEWSADLETLRVANEMILDSYHAFQAQLRLTEKDQNRPSDASDVDSPDGSSTEDSYDVHGLDESIHVAKLTAPYEKSFKAYDRTAMMVLGNNIHQHSSSSPYRAGTFDLLGLLATQESVHRVLRHYYSSSSDSASSAIAAEWLYQFYVARLASHFDGNQEYGRADDFLEELLLSPPSVKTVSMRNSSGSASVSNALVLIDPLKMAEDVIAMRSQVAMDWKDTVAVTATRDHTELRNVCLAMRMMGHTLQQQQKEQEKVFLMVEETVETLPSAEFQ